MGRGIDVSSISHIINFDIPQFADDYVHRVGRTGRMGREGVAYTFVTPAEGSELTRIEMRINRLLKGDEIPGFEAFAESRSSSGIARLLGGPRPHRPPASKPVFGCPQRRIRPGRSECSSCTPCIVDRGTEGRPEGLHGEPMAAADELGGENKRTDH